MQTNPVNYKQFSAAWLVYRRTLDRLRFFGACASLVAGLCLFGGRAKMSQAGVALLQLSDGCRGRGRKMWLPAAALARKTGNLVRCLKTVSLLD